MRASKMHKKTVTVLLCIESGTLRESTGARYPSECRSIKEGEVARSQVVRRLTSLITQIQDSTLGEQRICDLNDEINRLLHVIIKCVYI